MDAENKLKLIKANLDTIGIDETNKEWYWDHIITGMDMAKNAIAEKSDGGFKYELPHGDRTDKFGISGSLPNQFARDFFNETINKYNLAKEDAERVLEFMNNYEPHKDLKIVIDSSNTLVVFTLGLGSKYGFGSGIALREL